MFIKTITTVGIQHLGNRFLLQVNLIQLNSLEEGIGFRNSVRQQLKIPNKY